MLRRLLVVLASPVILFAIPATALAQTGANVLVVANENAPESLRIAERYAERRAVPASQVLRIRTAVADDISRADFDRLIQAPIAAWLSKERAFDRILYIVLTKGVPLRIGGVLGRTGTVASVDSELTLLYRRMTGVQAGLNGSIENPFFLGDAPVASASRFSHATEDIYLVTRLDGFTVDDALALIDRATSPATAGRVILDERAALNDRPNDWLAAAAKNLGDQGFGDRVLLDATSRVIDGEKDVLGYYSWGSNDPAASGRRPGLTFVPGAIAGMFLSADARTFKEPPESWRPGRSQGGQAIYAGSTQSLTGDLIRAGVTGVAGQVAEPYLDRSIRPDVLFPAYLAGFNLAEAFYMAMPALSWQTVIVGDPLCAPFHREPVAAADLDPPIDPKTELPASFSARRIASSTIKTTPEAVVALLRAQSRQARGDLAGAAGAYEEAVGLDDNLNDAWRTLGQVYEELKQFDEADAVYRKLIARNSKDAVALNNLAYSLAVRRGRPEEALPFADRAALLSPRSPLILDTFGWIKHLLGDNATAVRSLEPAAKGLPQNAEVQLHAAVVFAEVGRLDDAAKALAAAEKADPGVKDRAEFKGVRAKIGTGGGR